MDTRTKIVAPHAIVRDGRPILLIQGFFDPLHAATVRRLNELCKEDAVIAVGIADPPAPLLPWRARAELIAALACVDYVVDANASDSVGAERLIDERDADQGRHAALVSHVLARHRSA